MNIIWEVGLSYIGKRLTELSTWRGIVFFIVGAWGEQNKELTNDIVNYTFILVGLVGALLPDTIFSKRNKNLFKTNLEMGLDLIFKDKK